MSKTRRHILSRPPRDIWDNDDRGEFALPVPRNVVHPPTSDEEAAAMAARSRSLAAWSELAPAFEAVRRAGERLCAERRTHLRVIRDAPPLMDW